VTTVANSAIVKVADIQSSKTVVFHAKQNQQNAQQTADLTRRSYFPYHKRTSTVQSTTSEIVFLMKYCSSAMAMSLKQPNYLNQNSAIIKKKTASKYAFVCLWRDSPQWAMASSLTRFLESHTTTHHSR